MKTLLLCCFQYDTSSYGRRDTAKTGSNSTTDRPTTVTAKYTTAPSYKSSSIPVLSNEKNEKEKESPITAIANKYANYNKTEKPTSKYDKNDYSKLGVPSITTNKSRDPSPVSTTKYSLPRPSRHLSPERRTAKTFKDKSRDPSPSERAKDIPSKTDKSGYNSLSSYKLYPRSSSYTRPGTRTDTKSEVLLSSYRPSRADLKTDISVSNYSRPYSRTDSKSETTITNYSRPPTRTDVKTDITVSNYLRPSSRTENKPEITVNRYAIANRLSSNYLKSPPTVKRTSVSPVNHIEVPKREVETSVSPVAIMEEPIINQTEQIYQNHADSSVVENKDSDDETETVTLVTRHTSPTPPGSSSYVRSRRADMAKTVEKTITRLKRRPETADKENQSERLDDPTRNSRFGSTARTNMSNWSYYSPNSNYTGYAGRYSTQYSNLSPTNNSYDRSSRSRSRESQPIDNSNAISNSGNSRDKSSSEADNNPQIVTSVYEQNKGDDTSEIIINVNLKLKRAKSPSATELVSPEITITNSQLPPQAPKAENTTKTKKIKVKKSSTDSLTDSGAKKKIVKKRSKSVSSTDSDPACEVNDKILPSKNIPRNLTNSNLVNGSSKLKHSKSRESNSPESSITLSTQSSISEDEMLLKSKTNDLSRTSADEKSLSMDRSGRHSSPLSHKNENGTEEAKSFLIRALAPVTNLFKMRQPDSSENSRWLETSTSESTSKDVSNLITESDKSKTKSNNTNNIIASNDDNTIQFKGIRALESGERAWWLDSDSSSKKATSSHDGTKTSSDKNIPRKIKSIESGERAWWLESNSENSVGNPIKTINSTESSDPNRPGKRCKFIEEEKPWWLDSCANIPEGIERLTPPRKSSSDSEKSEKYNFFKIRHNDSGEQKDWWLTSNESSVNNNQQDTQSLSKSGSKGSFPLKRIRHVESGERPWWLCSNKNIPEGIEILPPPSPQEESESSDSEEVQVYSIPSHVPPFPLHLPDAEPLGDRRSPEGLETPNGDEGYRGRTSPYENNRQFRRRNSANCYQKGVERYISRYTDIDDILGTSGQIYSPFMDSILARRTGQTAYDDEECEEIDATQVRIHDSTAQRPVIKKIRSR